ncbi:MAG: CBS domain-containing protein [Chloroflexi bacterium]|nr:CBS domain-containing protein [Chloroflexota bacterium]
MFRHILVGLDGSDAAQAALKRALEMAAQGGGELTALSVEERLPAYAASKGEVEETKREMDAYFQKVQDTAKTLAQGQSIPLRTLVAAGHAAETIIRHAREGGYDLVVLGSGGRGMGGTADRVAEQAPCSVLIVRVSPLSVWVEDIMSRNVATVRPDAPLREVVHILIARGVKAVPVVDVYEHVQGIITGGDLMERGGLHHRLSIMSGMDATALAQQLRELTQNGKRARDVMTPHPLTIPARTPLAHAARLMAERQFKRLPVVDDEGKLVGIVARLDVLRAILHAAPRAETELEAAPVLGARLVREVMISSVPTASAEETVAKVMLQLLSSPYRRVVVVDAQRRVLGLITDHELIKRLGPETHATLLQRLIGHGAASEELTVQGKASEWMVRPVFTIQADAPIMDALRSMMEHRIKRLPVVNGADKLVGMVDRDAVLRAVVGNL